MPFILQPVHLMLMILATGGILTSLGAIFLPGWAGFYSLLGISACMSLMFPTIYGLAVRGLGSDTKVGGSGLIMAILGGALLTAAQGQVSDAAGSIQIAFTVPLLCFAVVAIFGLISARKPATT